MCVSFQSCRLKSNPQCIWGRAFGRWLGHEGRAIMNRISVLIKGAKVEAVIDFILGCSKITVDGDCSHEIKRCLLFGRKAMTNLDIVLKSRDYHFANKGPYSESYGFSSSHVRMWELDHKEGWLPKNWCFWTVMLGKTLESPLDCKEIKPLSPKGNQPWICIGRTNGEAKTPLLWPPDVKSWLIGKEPDAEKDWGQKKRAARMRWLDSITDSTDMNLSKLQQIAEDRGAWRATVHGVVNSQTWQWLKNNRRGLPHGSNSKESTYNARDIGGVGSIPGSGRSLGGGNGNPLQYSLLENPMDRRAWRATVHRVEKNWTWLSMHVLLSPHKRDPRKLSVCVQTQ